MSDRRWTRAEWGGVAFDKVMIGPQATAFLHHSVTNAAVDTIPAMRGLEAHALALGHRAIDYSEVVDETWRAEGRGPFVQGGHTLNWNSTSFGICANGDYRFDPITDRLLDNIAETLRLYVSLGALTPNFALRPHRDVYPTECPARLIDVIPEIRRRVDQPGTPGGDDVAKGVLIKKAAFPQVFLLDGNVRTHVRSQDALNVLVITGQAIDGNVHVLPDAIVDAYPLWKPDAVPSGGGSGGGIDAATARAIVREELDKTKVGGTHRLTTA